MVVSGAAQGIQAWMRVLDRSATAVNAATAQATNQTANPSSGGPDLIEAMVGMNLAAVGVKANIAVLRTADEMLGSLLDLRA